MDASGLTSNPLPLHPLIHHQPHPILELHNSFGRDGFDIGDIQMEAVMQRDDLTLHARCDNSGLAFDLDGFILLDDGVADFEVEGFFSPGFHAQLSQVSGLSRKVAEVSNIFEGLLGMLY